MAASMLQNSGRFCILLPKADSSSFLQQIRTSLNMRSKVRKGLPPERARSWKQRKEDIERIPPEENMAVNIGLVSKSKIKNPIMTRKEARRLRSDRNVEELERKARTRELVVPIEEVQEHDLEKGGQKRIHGLSRYFGIFRDLFGDAFFYPKLQLKVGYCVEGEEDMVNPVFHGNKLLPSETSSTPYINFNGESDKYYTLCMTAPDSHLEDDSKEYIHWMVTNIPATSMEKGETVWEYLPVFPVHGTGYHRYVFILYEHDKTISLSPKQSASSSTSLRERTFDTLEFYREYQDEISPVGISFFQAEWDDSVRNVFHKTLDMDEPRFEFLQPPSYVPKQELWPIRQPFNVYLDRYRDVKDIGEEVLREKLRQADPFKPRPPPRKYPNVYRIPNDTPSWLRMKINEQKLKKSYWKDLDD